MRYKLIVNVDNISCIGSFTLFIVSESSYKVKKQKKREKERR